MVIKERNGELTPTESCGSDLTEVEEARPFRAPFWPAEPPDRRNKDPSVDAGVPDRRDREGGESSAPDVQTSEGLKAVQGGSSATRAAASWVSESATQS